ncbi:MAG: polymerase sigma factor [Mucilaginibacter sp.]|nr:polymerase sigma factor [Mucilaginibacter sp.]
MMTDESLMISVKNGDLEKAGILYERYKTRLFQYFIFRTFNDIEVSKDNVQQVFMRLIKYRESYNENGNFKVWLYAIAANVKKSDIEDRLNHRHTSLENALNVSYVTENDNYKLLHEIMEKMPAQYREVLMMSRFWGFKYEEIAEIGQCSVGVIKTRVYRAMQMLREAYLKYV